jgi:hypothetical protein
MGAGQTGKEILHPLAIVVIGGLISSTMLDQLVTPALFYKFGCKVYERRFDLLLSFRLRQFLGAALFRQLAADCSLKISDAPIKVG